MKTFVLMVLSVLFLTGCATTPRGKVWWQPDKTAIEANRDLAQAERLAHETYTPVIERRSVFQQIADGNKVDDFIRHYMMGRGWMPISAANTTGNYPKAK